MTVTAGVGVKTEEGRDRKTKLYKINNLAAQVFHKLLLTHPSGKNALEYLKKRGVTTQTIKDFHIGYAPHNLGLKSFLLKKGFKNEEITQAGEPNRFFNRIIFPIRDALGNCLAFTGRATKPNQEPKYLNTAETIIFHKGRILYNLNQARGPIKQENATILVEGQMDVVASYQAGVKNVVATSGTALTDEHLKILYRYSPNLIFAFDSDTAGLKTAKKAYEMAIEEGFNVKMVLLQEFKDPGEMIAASPERWLSAVKNALPVIDWYFELAFNQKDKNGRTEELTSQEKKEIAKEILPIIKIIPDQIEQAHYINLLAKKLSVNEAIVFEALAKVIEKNKVANPPVRTKALTPEEILVAILLFSPQKITVVKDKLSPQEIASPRLRAIYSRLLKEYNKEDKDFIVKFSRQASGEEKVYLESLIFSAEELYNNGRELLNEDLAQTINHLRKDQKEALKERFAREIHQAEEAKDRQKLKALIKEFQEAISK